MDRLKFRLATFAYTVFMLTLCSVLFAHAQRPGEVTRGGAPEQIHLPLPVSGINPINSWGEMAALLTVLTVAFTVVSLLITKLIVMPAISDTTVKWNEAMKRWTDDADKKYVSIGVFDERRDSLDYIISRHIADDERRQESIERQLAHLIDLFSKGK